MEAAGCRLCEGSVDAWIGERVAGWDRPCVLRGSVGWSGSRSGTGSGTVLSGTVLRYPRGESCSRGERYRGIRGSEAGGLPGWWRRYQRGLKSGGTLALEMRKPGTPLQVPKYPPLRDGFEPPPPEPERPERSRSETEEGKQMSS